MPDITAAPAARVTRNGGNRRVNRDPESYAAPSMVSPHLKAPGTVDLDAPLTAKQHLFIEYLVDHQMSKSAAARAAGLSGKEPHRVANQLLENPKVAHAIAKRREQYAVSSNMSRQRVIEGFVEAIDIARLMSEPMTMIAGWREIGRMCGFYEPTKTKVEVSVNGEVLVTRMAQMTDSELLALAQGAGQVVDVDAREVPNPEYNPLNPHPHE